MQGPVWGVQSEIIALEGLVGEKRNLGAWKLRVGVVGRAAGGARAEGLGWG